MAEGYFLFSSEESKGFSITDIEKIYSKMEDDISKQIYVNRILYSLTLDTRFLREVVIKTEQGKKLLKKLYSYNEQKNLF